MKNLSIVLTSIFILLLAACAGLGTKTKVLFPQSTNDAQELANYVVGQHRDAEYSDCKSYKGCYRLLTNDFKETGDVAVINGLSVRVTVSDDGRRLFIHRYLILLFGENKRERVDISFMDKNIDGVVDVYVYEKWEDGNPTEMIGYANKKVRKNNGDGVDATAEEIALFQKYYDDNLEGSFWELMEEYDRYYY